MNLPLITGSHNFMKFPKKIFLPIFDGKLWHWNQKQNLPPNLGTEKHQILELPRFNGKLLLLTQSLNLPQSLEFLDLTKKIFAQIGW